MPLVYTSERKAYMATKKEKKQKLKELRKQLLSYCSKLEPGIPGQPPTKGDLELAELIKKAQREIKALEAAT